VARSSNHRPEKIDTLIGKVLEAATGGAPPPPESILAITNWRQAVGERLACNSRAVGLRVGKLHVEVRSPVWKQELMLSRRTIISNMNRLLGERLVADIVFTVRDWIDG
jgi:Dna[CI] antecedent, DciA